MDYARKENISFDLYIRKDAKISKNLREILDNTQEFNSKNIPKK